MGKDAKTTKKKFSVKKLLNRRIATGKNETLSRDVKTPKWLRAISEYFVGSYRELRQVRWPSRKSTWVLTLAVIIFTLVIAGLIVLLDYGFDMLFKEVIL